MNKQICNEEWKFIPKTGKLYMISNYGRVKSFQGNTERIIVQDKNTMDYPLATIFLNDGTKYRFLVHRMIYKCFNGAIPKNKIVHHKDGNKYNMFNENLELKTRKQHIQLHLIGKGAHLCPRRDIVVFTPSGQQVSYHKTLTETAFVYHKSVTTIKQYLRQRFHHREGLQFFYADGGKV